MKILSVFALSGFLVSCGKPAKKVPLYAIKSEALTQYVNQKSMPASPNLTLDKSIVNNDYPIEIALYQDQRFYYNLPNLGSGKGTWKYHNGKIQLKAKRSLFDMHIDALAADPSSSELAIQFSDRFGENTLKMMNVNL